MNCENCGHKLDGTDKFCTKCGTPALTKQYHSAAPTLSDEKWWYRLLKVAYVLLYVPLLLVLWAVWEINATTWSYYGGYQDNSGQAFWYCLIALVIYMTLARLIKIATLYIAMGKKPQWAREFKKLF